LGRVFCTRRSRLGTPVRKALEQLFGEARGRAQPHGFGTSPFGGAALLVGAGSSRLLQSSQAQRLDREVADFALLGAATHPSSAGQVAAASSGGAAGTSSVGTADEKIEPHDFFGLRRERVMLCAVEEAHRDCMHSLERHSFNRIEADWEAEKNQILNTMSPGGVTTGGGIDASVAAGVGAAVAPPQDATIVAALLCESVSSPSRSQLVHHICRLSCDSCPTYWTELEECWDILRHQLAEQEPTWPGVIRGGLAHLQSRFAEEMKGAIQRSGAWLGGASDAWSIIKNFGKQKFGTMCVSSATLHRRAPSLQRRYVRASANCKASWHRSHTVWL